MAIIAFADAFFAVTWHFLPFYRQYKHDDIQSPFLGAPCGQVACSGSLNQPRAARLFRDDPDAGKSLALTISAKLPSV